ncbi:MAG: Xanthine permease / 2-oxo-4-hydroxy-4-carboxy-5-ureidoimidazoline (OHCU) decarboxylase [uncultured Rubrobacteraceae bacterium]|uniref:Xanthine permease / 2-oxo-4-hydroxy-4-carboxy-5-ureidoimidazoline (OHCU) decarboxylase n=1 Tax=uncultured Rubrobacteraceae bacterium TaxID=349277 RepID=A0A6J4PZF0_9ACTN|nr:MAG: Xanthine permease / 2-oxo-4-hydroxy-4-carboxy-5-ureidoimidazoline (OHCU) decarboxylase [uncultured Rubrobacteraceae bacterium]
MAQATVERPHTTHPVDQVPPPGRLAVYGFQHVLAFYAGAVIVPILLASAIGLPNEDLVYLINADLFTCGIASIIQAVGFWKVGVRLPLLQGVTFTAVAPMIAIGLANGGGVDGLLAIYGAVIVAGIFTFLIAPYFSRLLRLFPPVVTGTVITIIGVALVPVGVQQAGGGDPTAPDFGSLQNIAFAGGTLLFILLMHRFFRGFLSTIAVLLSLIVGTAVAIPFGLVNFSGVGEVGWVGLITPFHFGLPTFGVAAIVSMIVVMLITMVETTGDVFATGEIVDKPIRRNDIARAIRADGLATTLGGILNSFPYTCFAENVGLVRLTNVKSRWVVAVAGAIMIVLGLLPKIGAVVAAIPSAVLGGAALILFATVAVIGIQTLSRVDFHDERNVVIIAVSIALALVPVAFPTFYQNFPDWAQIIVGSGITMGSLSAIFLNLVFNVIGSRHVGQEAEPAWEVPSDRMTIEQVNNLSREEFVERFGRLFQGPDWVAEAAYEERPFESVYELRRAFQDALFDAPPERQLELIRVYPDLGSLSSTDQAAADIGISPEEYEALTLAAIGGVLSPESIRDQSAAGLDRLSSQEYENFQRLNRAYRERFGFPLITAVRGNTKEAVLSYGMARLENVPAQEKATALTEIVKIANFRLQDLVEEPREEATVGSER